MTRFCFVVLFASGCGARSVGVDAGLDSGPGACEVDPAAPGCPCRDEAPIPCWDGSDDERDVGECSAGVIVCADDAWRACDGMVLPQDESCNGLDDDCDGQVDDGVLSECGTCGACTSICWGPKECEPWGDAPTGTEEDLAGALVLSDVGPVPHVLWLTDIGGVEGSQAPGAIYRFHTGDLEVEASYWTRSDRDPSFVAANVAVDTNGDVLVASSDLGGDYRATVSRIAGDDAACVDRDGDGAIETSSGPDDRLAFDAPDAWTDECILWHTLVGTDLGDDASAVAVGTLPELDGSLRSVIWVGFSYLGLYSLEAYDAETGEWMGIRTGDASVRDLLVDADGILWTALGPYLARFDPAAGDEVFERIDLPLAGEGWVDRLTIDETGTIWAAGTHLVSRTALGEIEVFDRPYDDPPGYFGNPTADGRGTVWLTWLQALASRDRLYRVMAGPGAALEALEDSAVATYASTTDFDGRVWSFGWMWSGGQAVDLRTGAITDFFEDDDPFIRPMATGDLTGFRRWTALHPRSPWTAVAEACPGAAWIEVSIDADLPVGTEVLVSARANHERDALASEPWVPIGALPGPESVFELGEEFDGSFLELSIRLLGFERTPALGKVEVSWSCP